MSAPASSMTGYWLAIGLSLGAVLVVIIGVTAYYVNVHGMVFRMEENDRRILGTVMDLGRGGSALPGILAAVDNVPNA